MSGNVNDKYCVTGQEIGKNRFSMPLNSVIATIFTKLGYRGIIVNPDKGIERCFWIDKSGKERTNYPTDSGDLIDFPIKLNPSNIASTPSEDGDFISKNINLAAIKTAFTTQPKVAVVINMFSYISKLHSINADSVVYHRLLFLLRDIDFKDDACIILVVNKPEDIPVFFYENNPDVKQIAVPKPDDKTVNKFLVETICKGIASNTGLIREVKGLTSDLYGKEYLAINSLFEDEYKGKNMDKRQYTELVNRFRYGRHDNPWTNILTDSENFTNDLEENLKDIKGQDEAVKRTKDLIKNAVYGLGNIGSSTSNSPKGVLFLAGPTGTGKTLTARRIAKAVFDSEEELIRFNMSEYKDDTAINKFIGSSPGYVGYEKGGELTEKVREKPFSVVLFDEIEKASLGGGGSPIFDVFLQILDEGCLTDGKGMKTFFSDCIIIFTSNIGVDKLSEEQKNLSYEDLAQKIGCEVRKEICERWGRPELFGRIGENNVVVYDFIREKTAIEILKSYINKEMRDILSLTWTNAELEIKDEDFCKKFIEKYWSNAEGKREAGARGIRSAVTEILVPKIRERIEINTGGGKIDLTKTMKLTIKWQNEEVVVQ